MSGRSVRPSLYRHPQYGQARVVVESTDSVTGARLTTVEYLDDAPGGAIPPGRYVTYPSEEFAQDFTAVGR